MSTTEERIKILEMIREGKLSADEGARLLQALQTGSKRTAERLTRDPRWLRVRVTDTRTSKTKVSVNLPMSLINVGIRMGARFVPSEVDFDADRVLEAIKSGAQGKIMDAQEGDEHIEMWVE